MNDKDRAIRLLNQREQGCSILAAMKSLWKRHVLYLLAILVCLYLRTKHDNDVLFLILTGFFIGTIVRDTDWLRTFNKLWPFTKKVTDWNKVKEIAEKEE